MPPATGRRPIVCVRPPSNFRNALKSRDARSSHRRRIRMSIWLSGTGCKDQSIALSDIFSYTLLTSLKMISRMLTMTLKAMKQRQLMVRS
jgi:hypothetical protein